MWVPRWAQVSFCLHTGFGCQEEGSHSGGNAFRGRSWSPSVSLGFAASGDVTSEVAVRIHAVAVIHFFSSQTMSSSAGMLSSFYTTIVERVDDRSSGREVLCSVLFRWMNVCRLFLHLLLVGCFRADYIHPCGRPRMASLMGWVAAGGVSCSLPDFLPLMLAVEQRAWAWGWS